MQQQEPRDPRSSRALGKLTLYLTVILLCLCAQGSTSAQCLSNSPVSSGRLIKTTGNPDLDMRFNQEATMIYSVFGVNPNLFIFDDGRSPNAYASPEITLPGYTGTVYFGTSLLRSELWSMSKGGHAVAGIMAHEFAHILQLRANSRLSGRARELHADFLAGYYLGRKSYFLPTDIRGFANSLFEKGDHAFWSREHHGTPHERVNAMVAGFQSANADLRSAYLYGERLF